MEQTSRRIWSVSSSTLASEILMSPAMTSPLSRMRSSTSTRPGGRAVIKLVRSLDNSLAPFRAGAASLKEPRKAAGLRSRFSNQLADGAEVEVEVFVLKPELRLQLAQLLFELHQGEAQLLDLLGRKVAAFHPAHGLLFEQAADQLDQRQDELRQALLDRLRIDVDALGQRVGRAP